MNQLQTAAKRKRPHLQNARKRGEIDVAITRAGPCNFTDFFPTGEGTVGDPLSDEEGLASPTQHQPNQELAHRYFDTAHSIVRATVTHDLPPLVAAVNRLIDRLRD